MPTSNWPMSLSTRTLYFISGNPHYDHIRKGIIEFYEDIRLDRALTCDTSTLTPPTSTGATNTTLDSLIQSESHSSHILQCILTVPAFMIHEVCSRV